MRIRASISYNIKRNKGHKSVKLRGLLGCSVSYCRKYLEKQFKNGMSWDNYGEWHIDHIMPASSFDLNSSFEQKKCFHYTNLQPLWALENMQKGNKILIHK